jgi:hypothetical protein
MKKLLSLILILSFVSSQSWGACTKPMTYLLEGATTPCTGYLATPEQEAIFYRTNEENNLRKSIIEAKDKQIDLFQQHIKIYADDNARLIEKNQQIQTNKSLENGLYFFAGAALTAFIAYGVTKAIKN